MFTIEDFDIKLNTEVIGRNFIYCEEVVSTNSELLENESFDNHGAVLLAEYQLHGRGRRSRNWVAAKEQALTFSILLKESINGKNISLLNLAASLSVAQALENLFQLNVNLKWPNDVLVDEKKISGILVESTSKGNKINKAVIGIGINVNQSVFSGQYMIPPTSVKLEFKRTVSRERLLSEILNKFEENVIIALKNKDKILHDWAERCSWIGEKVKIVSERDEKFGIFEGITETGELILKTSEGKQIVNSGDVSLRK